MFEARSCWQEFASQQDKIDDFARTYLEFLTACKTERETIAYHMQAITDQCAPEELFVKELKGKTLFVARKGKKDIADGLRIIGAHADTPRLDFKQHPLFETCDLALAKTHYYGGIRKYQWLSRPLALHGVVVKMDGQKVEVKIGEDLQDPVFVIADLLPHLAYKQNEQTLAKAFDPEKLNVILGNSPFVEEHDDQEAKEVKDKVKAQVLKLLEAKYGILEEDLFSAEIQVVPAGPARFVGLDRALIGGYGQDDRICVFTAWQAFLAAKRPEHTQVVIFWDKEEIGSEGATGAKSLFFEHCLLALLDKYALGASLLEVLQRSKAISADVHGAIDPDYQDLHDPLNASKLGFGPVFCKFTGHRGKVGANDAHPEYIAWLRNLLNKKKIPWQMAELGKVDMGGGGTVAKFLAVYGLDIIDFGPGVLGMHSPFELSSKADLWATFLAYQAFLNS